MTAEQTMRVCCACDALWRGSIHCPVCKEPTGEPVNPAPLRAYLEVMGVAETDLCPSSVTDPVTKVP